MSRFKSIPGFKGYKASSNGTITGPNGKLSPRKDKDGYPRVDVRKDGERKTRFVHTLVNSAHNGGGSTNSEVDHKNRSRTDNRASNLKSTTRKSNLKNRRFKRILG